MGLFKHVITHYDPRSNFSYYNLTTPILYDIFKPFKIENESKTLIVNNIKKITH